MPARHGSESTGVLFSEIRCERANSPGRVLYRWGTTVFAPPAILLPNDAFLSLRREYQKTSSLPRCELSRAVQKFGRPKRFTAVGHGQRGAPGSLHSVQNKTPRLSHRREIGQAIGGPPRGEIALEALCVCFHNSTRGWTAVHHLLSIHHARS